ncbi:hypothetical protein FB446DRAFT_741214 [Lentinula raphanica]|nr:hypothetical protein FB446DRAFT_741214 [Lentinula raphanica]
MHKQDLSKMILNYHTPRESGRSPDYERCLRHGMRLTRLMLRKPELLDTDFRLGVFPGLEAIEFYLRSFPVSFSWLPILSSNHPTLNQLWLLDQSRFFNLHTPPFISSFDEEAVRQDLKKGFDVKRVGLRRDIGQSSREWYVMAITLTSTSATTSLIQILTLVASSFPKLEILTLNLDLHQGSYSVGDLVSVFTQFSSLRDLFICDLYKRLDFDTGDVFGNDGFMSSPPAVDTSDLGAHYQCDETITHAASEILRLTSLLTKQVRNLDFLFFEDDMTPENEKSPHMYVGFGKRRYLKGLLPVHTSNRDVEAIFQLIKYRTAIH